MKPNNAAKRGRAKYKAEGRREKNKRRKLLKHIKKFVNDLCAKAALGKVKS